MKRDLLQFTRAFIAILFLAGHAGAATAPPDLAEYRTVKTAVTATISKSAKVPSGQSGYLGVSVAADAKGKLRVSDTVADSPAAKAGMKAGDVILKLDGKPVSTAEALRDLLQGHEPGDAVSVAFERQGKAMSATARLGATSQPKKISDQRAVMGVQVAESDDAFGAPITRLTTGLPASKAGLKTNDVILRVNGVALTGATRLTDVMSERKPGDKVTLVVKRENDEFEKEVELVGDAESSQRAGVEPRTMWKKPVYRLAIIPVEYTDTKHNPGVPIKEWEQAIFSTGVYNKTNVSGATVYGSLNDYYQEQSVGQFHVDGRAFDWLTINKKRGDFSQAANSRAKEPFYTEIMDTLLKREGKDALKDFDGVIFIYAGERYPNVNRGSLYWPHRASFTYKGKKWPYFICAEGGKKMSTISVYCHEFGHMLGLPDLYARPELPGSEGMGNWCAMSNQVGNGRPQHFGAWCLEQLGWLNPVVIDPTVKQKLVLGPILGSTNECFKVLLRPDGSEYLLLENRRKKGFDSSLPGEGLLIWRVVGNRPMLEESHGVDGPAGPRVFLSQVPYPSASNDAYTPYTTPSSRSMLGGGLPVHITNIRQLADGRVTFQVGYEYE